MQPPPPLVTVAQPVEREVIEWDEYSGHLAAVDYVDLRARVSGYVTSAPFEEGALVRAGQTLVTIDVRPFQAELDSRLADVARAQAQVEIAEIEANRLRRLMPQQAAAPFEYQTAEATLRQNQAVLAGAKAAVESARLNVEWCNVTAPINGRVSNKYVTPGNLISGASGQGTELTTIASIDPIYCYMDVDERSVLKYQRLAREKKRVSAREARIPCFMQLANETGFPHEGVIDFVDNRIDPTTGTMRGRGVFPNPGGWLAPGFFARVRVPGSGLYKALLVPDSAVVSNQSEKFLMVLGPDNVVQARHVELGSLFGELRAITSGVTLQDHVLISGLVRAQPGVKVIPQPGTISTASMQQTAQGSPSTQELPREDGLPTTAPANEAAIARAASAAAAELSSGGAAATRSAP
jgi:membrane fusion protein, multidrug efflux system